MRILVAEDERDLNEILCKKLRSEDYCVDGCFDGEETLDYLASVDYDAVILDIMMPKRSGLEVVEQLRRQGNAVLHGLRLAADVEGSAGVQQDGVALVPLRSF